MSNRSASSQLPQVIKTPVEDVRVPAVRVRVRVLPDCLVRPAARDGAGRARVPRQHERVGRDEGVGIARAAGPPRRVGVQHRVPARAGVVPVAEGLDPRHHGGRGQAPARRAALGLEVQHARECDAVAGPAAAVGDEVVRLRGGGGLARVGEVVAAADEAGLGGAGVVGGEGGVGVGRALGCLCDVSQVRT